MKIEIIGGVEYEVGTAAHRKAVEGREAEAAKATARMDALEGENATLREQVKGLQTRLDAAPEEFAKAAAARAALIQVGESAGVEVREDMSDDDIRRAVVAQVSPGVDLEGKSPEYVAAAFDVSRHSIKSAPKTSALDVRADAVDAKRGTTPKTREDGAGDAPDVVARRNMIERQRKAANQRRGVDKG